MMRTAAFTLIEVMLAMSVLLIGITAAFSVIMLGIDWATSAKIANIGYDTGFLVLQDARNLKVDPNVSPADPSNNDNIVKGRLNTFFLVRTINSRTVIANGMETSLVTVEIFHGGDDETNSELVGEITAKVMVRP